MKLVLKGLSALLLVLVALIGAGVALTWAPDRPVADLAARWAPPPSQFLTIEGMGVHLRDEGPRQDERPLVLLHGTSASLHTWDGWTEALRSQRRVIRLDLPGFGLTGPFPDGDYRIEHYVRWLLAVLDRLGVGEFVLVGNSFGGRIAWETALAAPERVQQLVLVDAAGYPSQARSVPLAFRLAKIPVLNQLLDLTLPRRVVESSVRNVYGDPAKVTPALVDRYYELTLRAGNRAALPQRFRQAPAGVGTERIATLKLPTLILWGERDRLIPPADGERFQREIAGSGLIIFPGLGHVPQEEDPQTTVVALRGFLARP